MALGRSRQGGFGYEMHRDLMVFVCVVGVLAAVVLPTYLDYKSRAAVKESLDLAGPVQAAVARAFEVKGAADMSREESTGWKGSGATRGLQRISIERDGAITLVYSDEVTPAEANQLQIVPVVGGSRIDLSQAANAGRKFTWQCGGAAGKTTVPRKLRPDGCR